MKPSLMEIIGAELGCWAESLVDPDRAEPSPEYISTLSVVAMEAKQGVMDMRTCAAHLVCQFVDSATASVLYQFPEACRDVAVALLRDHESSSTPVHDLSDSERVALQLAHSVLCFVTRDDTPIPPREETE